MKIFISAVSAQLRDCRIKVATDLRAKHEVKIQEDFTLGSGTLLERLEDYIKDCDCIIAIIGDLFGCEPPENSLPENFRSKRRSYTQWEYFFALGDRLRSPRGSKKMIKVYLTSDIFSQDYYNPTYFLSKDGSKKDLLIESTDLKNLQLDFINQIKESGQHYSFFNNADDLRAQVLHDLGSPAIEDIVRNEYPTILVKEYFNFKNGLQPRRHKSAMSSIVGILSYIWAKDIEQSEGVPVCENVIPKKLKEALDTLVICHNYKFNRKTNLLIPHFRDWYKEISELINSIIRDIEEAIASEEDSESEEYDPVEAKIKVDTLSSHLKFLSDEYLFVTIQGNASTSALNISIFKGEKPVDETLELKYGSFNELRSGDEFILSLVHKRALPFRTNNTKLDLSDLVLFSDDSWRKIRGSVLPDSRKQELFDHHIDLTDLLIHSGYHTLLYKGKRESDEEGRLLSNTEQYLICFIQDKSINDKDIKSWFIRRAELWVKLDNLSLPNVNRIKTLNIKPDCANPFIALRYFDTFNTLDWLKNKQNTEDIAKYTLAWIKSIAETCQIIHQSNLFLLTLSLRHFLVKEDYSLLFTGFDTLWEKNTVLPEKSELSRMFKDFEFLAPELKHGGKRPQPTADIWALGLLFKNLFDLAGIVWSEEKKNRTKMFLKHCTSKNPIFRFQTVNQFLYFFQRILEGDESTYYLPDTVRLTGKKKIGKFPIMNFEFAKFCYESNYYGGVEKSQNENLPEDIKRPFLPAVGVSMVDAKAYCDWLSKKTNVKWRLPTEKEWISAAYGSLCDSMEIGHSMLPGRSETFKGHFNVDHAYPGPTIVGSFESGKSAIGCSDLFGNVWEWCSDKMLNAPLRILKGGSFQSPIHDVSVHSRRGVVVAFKSVDTGFRVICEE